MVIVRIELWPQGDPEKSRLLGVAKIANDNTGDEKRGNYDVHLSHAGKYIQRKSIWKRGRVENHKRTLSPYHLVYKAFKNALGLK